MRETPRSRGDAGDVLDPRAVLEVCLCHHARRAARAITRRYDAALASAGLTSGQYLILAATAAHAPITLPALRELLAMDRTSLARTVKPLQENGFIEISAGAGRRPGRVSLTGDGAAALGEAGPLWRAAQREATERLGPARSGQLIAALAGAAAVFDDQ